MTTENTRQDHEDDDPLAQAIWDDPALIEALAARSPVERAQKAGKFSRRMWSAAIAACFCATVLGGYVIRQPANSPSSLDEASLRAFSSQTFVANTAQDVALSDGTRVALNRFASLQFQISSQRRSATLSRGEAYFEVARDEARPFVIDAGNSRIQVLGTAFNVDKSLTQTQIDVFHGRVAVSTPDGLEQVELTKGQRAKVTRSGITVTAFAAEMPDWQAGWLELDDVSLNDAVYQLNRYSDIPVVLQKVDGSVRISGRFRADDVVGTAHLIASMQGLTIQEFTDSIVLKAE